MAPNLVKEALAADGNTSSENAHDAQPRGQPSSSSWEGPLADSQAIAISDYLLNEQETTQYLGEDNEPSSTVGETSAQEPESGPSWENGWTVGFTSHQYPRDLGGYSVSGETASDTFW